MFTLPLRAGLSGGVVGAAIAVVTLALVYGFPTLKEWYDSRHAQVDHGGYFQLPPKDGVAAAELRAINDDLHDTQALPADAENGGSASPRREKCVCCHDLLGRFMFLPCGHICMCEPCLIRLGYHEVEEHRASLNGPCRLPCPICRTKSFVMKTYLS